MAPIPNKSALRNARGSRARCIRMSAVAALLLIGSAGGAAADPPAGKKVELGHGDIALDAASFVVNSKNQTAEYKDVVIRQDDIKVQADRAHAAGLTLDKADWT